MIIGFDAKRAFNNLSGLGNYSRTLITSLTAAFPEHQYVLFTPTIRLKFSPKAANIAIIKPDSALHQYFSWYWRSFHLTIEQQKAGLNVFHGLSNELPFGTPPKGIRQIVTIHDLIFLKYPQYYPLIDRKIYEAKVKHSCKIADTIIAISEQTKHDIAEWMPVVADKIEVVYQSCDERFQKAASAEELKRVKSKFKLPEKYILYVGAIAERKNILNLVKAYAQLSKDTDTHLVLAGNGGSYKTQVKSLVQELGLQSRVRFVEQFETEDLPALYQSAELFVYPSEYEGFGIPIIEALWSGVPVITTQGGCFPEAGGAGSRYVDTTNVDALAGAMKEILGNESLQEKMISGGKRYVQRFRNEVVVGRMMEVYQASEVVSGAVKVNEDGWYPFDDGKTLGQLGSEGGKIIMDVEHLGGARITMEKNGGIAPFSVTLGVYGVLFHTHFCNGEEAAQQFVKETKLRIETLFAHLSVEKAQQDNAWKEVFNKLTHEICE